MAYTNRRLSFFRLLATRVTSEDGVPVQDTAGECARDVFIDQPEGNGVVAETSERLRQRHLLRMNHVSSGQNPAPPVITLNKT